MSTRSSNILSKITLPLFLAIFMIYPHLNTYASGFPDPSTRQGHSNYSPPVDYRHMALYQLKLNRYYHPPGSGNPNNIRVEHSHHHSHWAWWGVPFFWGGYTSDRNFSFGDRVSDGLVGVGVVVAVVAITAATIYSVAHAVWPYVGAASLTAIELPENSPWKITGYKVAHGGAIQYSDLAFNEDAMINAREYEMYDRQKTAQGRFLLLDQENWWGIIDYPVDADVTFTRFDDISGEAIDQVTVNIQRTITNGMKAGNISTRVVHATQNQQNYQLVTKPDYPDWFDFSSWYHTPSRLMVDFKNGGYP